MDNSPPRFSLNSLAKDTQWLLLSALVPSLYFSFSIKQMADLSYGMFFCQFVFSLLFVAGLSLVFLSVHRILFYFFGLTISLLSGVLFAAIVFVMVVYGNVNQKLTESFTYVILDSNPREGLEYLKAFVTIPHLALLVAVVAVPMAVLRGLRRRVTVHSRVGSLACGLLLVGLALGLLDVVNWDVARPFRPVLSSRKKYKEDLKLLRTAFSEEDDISLTRPERLARKKETIVLVIGESTTRENMQIYGYGRETTPMLQARRDELLVFQDTISAFSHTIPVIKSFFVVPYGTSDAPASRNFISVLKKAGFKTWWLSNQTLFGSYDTWATVFAKQADEKFFQEAVGTQKGENLYDTGLLRPLKTALQDRAEKKFIVLHLIGTHVEYSERYPESASFFDASSSLSPPYKHLPAKQRALVDEYDNAVRFNDGVVSKMLDLTQQADRDSRSAFLYLSDHGEEVCHIDGFFGHLGMRSSRYMFEVPFVVWMNDEIKKEKMTLPKAVLESRRFKTDDLAQSLFDMLDIDGSFTDRTRSIFSKAFAPRPRITYASDYDVYRKIPGYREMDVSASALGSKSFSDKVWLHRTDSKEKLAEFFDRYGGFELDVVFDEAKNEFDVTHPPAPSIGLGLEDFFSSQAGIAEKYYWLDTKNLSPENAEKALHRLNEVVNKFGLKDRVVVESPRPELLTMFSKSGYYTSYYLPDAGEFEAEGPWLSEIIKNIRKSRIHALSTTDAQYQILGRFFSEFDFLLWNPNDIKKLKQDEQVKVILVHEKSKFER